MQKANINTAPIVKRYRTWASITIGAIVLLILAGGIVRMTGSGMGCPDWPKCFGQWIPPTDISQLPTDYKSQFAVVGREVADFEAFKTWVEYINRLLGVLVGFFAIITAALSYGLRKIIPSVFYQSLAGLLLVIVEGGIGAYVVRTHLQAGMVTLHMVVALAIFAVYLNAILKAKQEGLRERYKRSIPKKLIWLSLALLVITTVQIIMGTQVREAIDVLAVELGEGERANWISQLGAGYDWHSMGYYAVLGIFVWLLIQMKNYYTSHGALRNLIISIGIILALEVALGLGMHHLGIPAFMQPSHLLLASLLFGAEFLLLRIMMMLSLESRVDVVYDHQRNKEVFSHS
ncbi:MAG: COX15/CtaA family protein [Bacteroidota bacterium]